MLNFEKDKMFVPQAEDKDNIWFLDRNQPMTFCMPVGCSYHWATYVWDTCGELNHNSKFINDTSHM